VPIAYDIDWDKISTFKIRLAHNLVLGAVKEARTIAKVNAITGPYATGRLARSIGYTVRTTPGWVNGRVGSSLDYAAAAEKGARPHTIRARRPGRLLHFYWDKKGRWVHARQVNHPGQKGKRYLLDALVRVARRKGFIVIS
jgi:hypothetical protein